MIIQMSHCRLEMIYKLSTISIRINSACNISPFHKYKMTTFKMKYSTPFFGIFENLYENLQLEII